MKTIFLCFTLFSLTYLYGQTEVTRLKAVSLIEDRVYELDGGSIMVFGQSRETFSFILPKNTIEWYYVFTSYSNANAVESKSNSINLLSQITRIIDQTGTTASVFNAVLAPTGSAASDVYVLGSESDAYNFKIKTDHDIFTTDTWKVYSDYCIHTARHGKMKINSNIGTKIYMGIKAGTSPVIVKIDVVAIVMEKVVDYSIWSDETIATMKSNMMELLEKQKIDHSVSMQLTECTINKIKTEFSPEFFEDFPEDKTDEIIEDLYKKCYEELSGQKFDQNTSKAETLGNLSWETYMNGNIEKAIELSLRALELNRDLSYVKGNLGLYYFVQGKNDLAIESYIDAITLFKADKIEGTELFKAAHDDLKAAIKKYPNMNGYQAILAELERGMQ